VEVLALMPTNIKNKKVLLLYYIELALDVTEMRVEMVGVLDVIKI
jgi:hypothetical protein